MNRGLARLGLFAFTLTVAYVPHVTFAQVANIVFVSEPQTVAQGIPSQQITLQAQSSGGTSTNIPSTACIALSSPSTQGQFSSSATNWSPVSVLTMNKNTANKNFYYQDAGSGSQTLTAKVALKPDTVTSSCASWPIDEWSIQWTATQLITIGAGTTSNNQNVPATSSDTTSNTQTQNKTSAPVSSYVAPPAPLVFADAGSDRTVIVGADTKFDGRAYNKKQEVVDHVRFLWNFGDGSTAEGPAVMHHFSYPGRYAVMLDIAEDTSAASDEIIVTAEPPKLAFKTLSDSGVEIDNFAGRDLDLSGWLVREGAGLLPGLFKLPEHSIILAGSSMHISKTTLGFAAGSQAQLQYPNGTGVLQAGERTADTPSAPNPPSVTSVVTPVSRSSVPVSARLANTSFFASEEDSADSSGSVSTKNDSVSGEGAAAGATVGGWSWWWIAAIALSLAAAGALVAAQYVGKGEWDIIEEKPEAE